MKIKDQYESLKKQLNNITSSDGSWIELYEKIIELDSPVVPFIIADLKENLENDWWKIHALIEITGVLIKINGKIIKINNKGKKTEKISDVSQFLIKWWDKFCN